MKFLLFILFLIPTLACGMVDNVIDFGARLAGRSFSSELSETLGDLGIKPKLLQEQTLKKLEEAMDDPLKLVEVDPKTGPNFDAVLESDILSAFFFSRLDLSNEKQMKTLTELLDQEAELYPHAQRTFQAKTDIESLFHVWGKFLDGLGKGVESGRIEPRLEVNLHGALLSVFKRESDTGLPIYNSEDLLGMYDLHPNRVVRNAEERFYLSSPRQVRATLDQNRNSNIPSGDNVTPLNSRRSRMAEIMERPFVPLLGYNIKPHVLFGLIVWRGDFKSGRYRFLPDINPEEGVKNERLKTPYRYTEEEIERLAEIYTSPHFRLNPNDSYWDEIAVPLIENPYNLGSKKAVLKAWKDLEWIEKNRWDKNLWSHEGERDHVMGFRKREIFKNYISRIINDFIDENFDGEWEKEAVMSALNDTDNVFVRSFIRASTEDRSLVRFFNETLDGFFDESS